VDDETGALLQMEMHEKMIEFKLQRQDATVTGGELLALAEELVRIADALIER